MVRTENTNFKRISQVLLLCIILLTLSKVGIAQKKGTPITYKGNLFTNKYYKGVWSVSQQEAFNIMKENGECYNLATQGKKLQKTGNIAALVGGVLIGYPLGSALAGSEDPKWFLAGIGGGLVLFAIPVYSSGTRKIHQAVELYNETKATAYYKKHSFIKEINLKAGVGNIGITMAF